MLAEKSLFSFGYGMSVTRFAGPELAVDPVEDEAVRLRERLPARPVDAEQAVEAVRHLRRQDDSEQDGDTEAERAPRKERRRLRKEREQDERRSDEEHLRPALALRPAEERCVQHRGGRVDVQLLVDRQRRGREAGEDDDERRNEVQRGQLVSRHWASAATTSSGTA